MSRLELAANKREKLGKGPARQMRLNGQVPAVLYGLGEESQHLSIEPKYVEKILLQGKGSTELIDLKIEGGSSIPVLIKEYQANVLNRKLRHVDFIRIDLEKDVEVDIPIHLIGKAQGVKDGGVLEQYLRKVHVTCKPTAIPEHIDMEVTELGLGGNLHVSDMVVPDGVKVSTRSDLTVAAVLEPKGSAKDDAAEAATEEAAAAPAEGEKAEEKK